MAVYDIIIAPIGDLFAIKNSLSGAVKCMKNTPGIVLSHLQKS